MFLLVIAVAGLIFWLMATQEKIASLRWRVERLEKRLEQQAPSVKPTVNAPAAPVMPAQSAPSSLAPEKAAPAPAAPVLSAQSVPHTTAPQAAAPQTGAAAVAQAPKPLPPAPKPNAAGNAPAATPFSPVKLLSWVGGFAFLLAAIFGVKYSLDHGFLSPTLRFVGLLLVGAAAWISGLCIKKEAYATTAHTLTACGACVFWAAWFAGYAFYHIMGMYCAFGFMTLTALLAFVTAVWKKTAYMGVLAQIAAFLVPLLMHKTLGELPFLLVYLGIINTAALAAAYWHKWKHQFILSAVLTGIFMFGLGIAFSSNYASMLMAAVFFFCALYAAGGALLKSGSVLLVSFICMTFSMLFMSDDYTAPFVWAVLANACFVAVPFVRKRDFLSNRLVWGVAAVAGFWAFLVLAIGLSLSNGLVAFIFAGVYAALAAYAYSWEEREEPAYSERLAWLSATAVILLSIAITQQFEKAGLTTALALEGCALVWLQKWLRVPVLSAFGKWILTVATVRLVLNPAVLEYRMPKSIFNWFLYIYPTCAATAFLAAQGWPDKAQKINISWLRALGGLILFALVNLEIAVAYSSGNHISWNILGSFAEATAYTVAWLLCGGICLCVALRQKSVWLNRCGLVLIGAAVCKLFLYDVWQLPLGVRVLILLGVAVVLIALSFMYQHFWANKKQQD